MDQEKINQFKLRIEKENKNNNTSRRRYSKKLKQDLVDFSNQHNISSYLLGDRIGISYTAIDNWKRKLNSQFNKIEISSPPRIIKSKQHENKGKNDYLLVIKINQIVLIILASLLLADRLFFYSIG